MELPHTVISDRERFLALLFAGRSGRGDAIVCLCGEDGKARGEIAFELFKMQMAPVVVCSGGIEEPPHVLSGATISTQLLAAGIAPDRILVEGGSQNTREQAVNCVALAVANEWKTVLLVASPYHLARATLTFLAELDHWEIADTVRLVPVVASLPWAEVPPGCSRSRLDLLAVEFDKIDRYEPRGDAASYASGVSYLALWESRCP